MLFLKNGMNFFHTISQTEDNLENLRSKLGAYLAGLVEADGSIAVHDVNSNAKKYRPKILLVFTIRDKPLADKLASITNAGTVYAKLNAGHVIWQIQKTEDVIKIINIINGFMRTPKIEALHRAINWFNTYDNLELECLNLDNSPINSNAWLAGFTDSHSSFIISKSNRNNTSFFSYKFKINIVIPYIEKKEWCDLVYFSLFKKISEYLNTSFITKSINNEKYTFIVLASSIPSLSRLIQYRNKYPLLELWKASLDYANWCENLGNKYSKRGGKFKEVENLNIQLQNRQKMLGIKTLSQKRNFSTSYILQSKKKLNITSCTDSYSIQDVVRIINTLIIRYDLKCTLHKSNENYRIYISRNSVHKVVRIVKPHLIPSMYYKIGIT